ncbi:MmgE/PrpD family protein [Microbacterium gallinarum]|uniref:MmgE/PrpD family protein n=1 Tax=Microbacterium gallinarum TaxID=2762209 RepID=UPI00296F0CCF|nr:MmgE/PrpD family protein [Microbacterium gallinarum]
MTETTAEIGVTQTLAAFAADGPAAGVDHRDAVARALVDTVGVSLGAAGTPGERILADWARAESSAGTATVWTTGEKASPSVAALVNGTAAHVLDFDDYSPSMPLHPSAVILPALVAVAESGDVTPTRFVEAYDVGAAAFRALADVLPQHVHYARGWHSTSTIGRLAAVAALVRLVGLDRESARHALGIVSSLAAGSRPNFGSMTKPFHAGSAARDAVMAVELAGAGFTGNPDELEAPGGFLERYGDPDAAPVGSLAETLDERLEYWQDAWPRDWGLKRYPSCYGTHRGIDAMLQLRSEGIAGIPTRIRATLHPRGTRPLRTAPPTDPTQAKFSLEYCLASAFLRGGVGLDDFTLGAFSDPEVRSLMGAVSVAESAVPPTGDPVFQTGYTVVELEFEDGSVRSARVEVTRGQAGDPLSDAELRAKFVDCCSAGGIGVAGAERIFASIQSAPGAGFTSLIPRRTTA